MLYDEKSLWLHEKLWGFFGNCLLWLYVLNGFVGKSRLPAHWYGGWQGHMMASAAIIMGLLLYCLLTKKIHSYSAPFLSKLALICLYAFIGWGIVVSLLQDHPSDNLIYFVVLASMFVVSMMLPNRLVIMQRPSRFLNLIVLFTSAYVCLSLAVFLIGFPVTYKGRLCGLANGPIVLGGLSGLNCLLLVWFLLESNKHRKLRSILLGLSLIALALTKCRAQIVTTILGVVVLTLFRLWHVKTRAIIFSAILVGSIFLAMMCQMGIISDDRVADIRNFFRASEGEITSTLNMRYESYWSKGITDITDMRLVGQGPLVRFGGGGQGFEESHYDRSLNRHSQILIIAQSYGLLGLVFWTAFIVSACFVVVRRPDNLGSLGVGIFSYLIIMSLVSESLLSFGTPVDRLRWLILGILLSSPLQISSQMVHQDSIGKFR